MTNIEINTPDEQKINHWVDNNSTVKEIEDELMASGYNTNSIETTTLRTFKKIKNAWKHSLGVTCLISGAVVGFSGFVLALLNPVPALFHFFSIRFNSCSNNHFICWIVFFI